MERWRRMAFDVENNEMELVGAFSFADDNEEFRLIANF